MPETAVVTATFSRRMQISFADGSAADARIKGRRLKPVCGDRVVAEPQASDSDWLISAILPRDNELSRPNLRGQSEVLAANIDLLMVVAAPVPAPDWFLVDRYLSAAELMGVDASVVWNKLDAGPPDEDAGRVLAEYEALGYRVIRASAAGGDGLPDLAAAAARGVAVLAGQSGVGKSSLINALTGSATQRTADLSERGRSGRHTTVNSVMLRLPRGGALIDSPGVRDYAPAIADPADVGRSYREVREFAADCRFHNCRHLGEPGCAVKAAVGQARISERRYESYRRLLDVAERYSGKR